MNENLSGHAAVLPTVNPSIAAAPSPFDSPISGAVEPFRLGTWLVRPDRHSIVDRSEPAADSQRDATDEFHLEPRVMELLLRLCEADGDVVSKEELVRSVWDGAYVSDSAVTRAVSELRRVLRDDAQKPRYIETIPKRGYRLVVRPIAGLQAAVPVSSWPVGPGTVSGAQSELAGSTSVLPAPRRRLLVTLLALAAVGVASVIALGVQRDSVGGVASAGVSQVPLALPLQHLTTDIGLEIFPTWSPDGQRMAYSSDRDGSYEIYVRHLVPGGGEIQLTDDGAQNIQAAWSPDGNWIAYHSLTRGGIWIVSSVGGDARRLSVSGSSPSWSPDSRQLVFQSASHAELTVTAAPAMPPSTLWLIDLETATPRALTRPSSPQGGHGLPRWSPTGDRIAFISWSPHDSKVWTLLADGTGLTSIETVPPDGMAAARPGMGHLFGLRALAWAASGDALYLSARLGGGEWLWLQEIHPRDGRASAKALPLVRGSFRHLAASSRGELAVTKVDQHSRLWSTEIDPLRGQAIADEAPFTQERNFRTANPRLSPDGSTIVYRRRRTGEVDQLRLVPATGGRGRDLTIDPQRGAYSAYWRPDGRSLVYSGWVDDQRVLLEIDVETRRVSTAAPLPPSWGKPVFDRGLEWAAFDRLDENQRVNVFVMPYGKPEELIQVTSESGFGAFPKWSPDASRLAVEIGRPEGAQIAVVDRNGGGLRELTAERGAHWPGGWSLDGSRVLFTARRAGRWSVRWVDVASGKEELIAGNDSQNVFYRDPIWLPDRIVYERGEVEADLWLIGGLGPGDS